MTSLRDPSFVESFDVLTKFVPALPAQFRVVEEFTNQRAKHKAIGNAQRFKAFNANPQGCDFIHARIVPRFTRESIR